MSDRAPEDRLDAARAALAGRIRRTRWAIAAERAAAAFWPALTVALFAAALFLSGITSALPARLVIGIGALAVLGVAYALVRGGRAFLWPSEGEAVARLDAALPGRPLSALRDRQAIGSEDPDAVAVWTRHLERMAARAAEARAARPDLRVAARDPWALRLSALVAVIAALLFAGQADRVDLTEALAPDLEPQIAAGPSFEAWAAPPAYTGKPTLYFNDTGTTALELPIGTEVTVRVYGDTETFTLEESISGDAAALAAAAKGIGSASFEVRQSGDLAISNASGTLGRWEITVIPDAPPTIALAGEIERAVSGAMQLSYSGADDYGVTGADLTISLDMTDVDRRYGLALEPEPRPAIELDLPLPLSGAMTSIEETLIEDLTTHPWAGLPVRVKLRARDAAGQLGESDVSLAILPGRRFFDPLAQAVIEQRRDLLWNRDNAPRIDQMLRTITHAPEDIWSNSTAYMMTRMALRRLGYAMEGGLSDAERDDLAELLWNVALLIEDGSLSDARERLRRAQERLQEALRNGATEEELAELMQELRQAMQEYMQQLAQEALERGEMAQNDEMGQNQMSMTQDQLQELMDRIQELAEQGRTEEAEALLQQLQQLMENLQMQLSQGPGQQGGEGQQMMQELQDTLRQQQGLADDSFQQLQREFQQGQPGQQGQQPGQQQPGQGQGQQGQQFGQQGQQPGQPNGQMPGQGEQGLSAQQLADRQEALRRMLDDLRGRLPGPSSEEGQAARDALGEAERQMGEARDNLDDGNLSGALDRQADAIDALRDGLRGLGEELQQQAQQSQGQTGQDAGQGMAEDDRDPLGRPNGARGSLRTDENMLPGLDQLRRAQELFDEIRRRASDRERPEFELDYLQRLLDRF
ncbi:MAG: TIGR02302 family protein [Pseudomonadota bacterium]